MEASGNVVVHVVLIAGAVGAEDLGASGGASLNFGIFALCAETASSPASVCSAASVGIIRFV